MQTVSKCNIKSYNIKILSELNINHFSTHCIFSVLRFSAENLNKKIKIKNCYAVYKKIFKVNDSK